MPQKKTKKQPAKKPRKPTETPADPPRSTRQRQKIFLESYRETCNIVHAAREARINRASHYDWMKDEEYARLFGTIRQLAGEWFEAALIKRASVGWEEPVFYQGKKCGTVRRFDGGLGQFLLRGLMPEKYGNKTEISGPQGTPIQAKIEVVFVEPEQRP